MGETLDFFQGRLDSMIDLAHPLAVLGTRLPWAQIEADLRATRQRPSREATLQQSLMADLFDLTSGGGGVLIGGGVSRAGRPPLNVRLMVSLLYLKNAFNLSDEALCERWSENVVWQHFSGMHYYEPRPPCDPTQIGRFRTMIGEAGMEAILKATIDTAVACKAIKPAEFERIIVDTTVQEKAIAYPVDSRLLEIARYKVVKAAKGCGIALRQSFAKEGKTLRRKAGGYAHARQFKRLARAIKRQRTIVGKLIREVRGKLAAGLINTSVSPFTLSSLSTLLERADQVRTQQRHDKNKLYALHAPEVECISKGKARNRYEFGVKVSLAVTHKQGLIVGAKRFTGNPFDGHTLAAQIGQANGLIEASGKAITEAYVDFGLPGRGGGQSGCAGDAPGAHQIDDEVGETSAASATGGGACDRACEARPSDDSLSPDRELGRRAAFDCLCGRLQHQVADASDAAFGPERAFCALKSVAVGEAQLALERHWSIHASDDRCRSFACACASFSRGRLGGDLNFAGTTKSSRNASQRNNRSQHKLASCGSFACRTTPASSAA